MVALTPVTTGFSFLESPRWHRGLLWAVDLYTHRVVAFTESGELAESIDVPGQPSGLGWQHDDSLIVALTDHRLLQRTGHGWELLADLSRFGPARLGELVVTGADRIFVALFGLASGALLRVDRDGTVAVVAEDLLLPNGLQLETREGRLGLLVAESAGQRVTAFDVDDAGELTQRRAVAVFGPPAHARQLPEVFRQVTSWPDGICGDGEGTLWVANPLGNEVLRVVNGTVSTRISTAPDSCHACALGGTDPRTLYLCTAPARLSEDQHKIDRRSGISKFAV